MFSPMLLFFLLTFLSSWLFFGIAIANGMVSTEFPGMLFHILGGFCPSLVAVVIVLWKYDSGSRCDFWRCLLNYRRIRPTWWLITLLLTPVLVAAAVVLDVWLGAPPPELTTLKALLADPISLLITTIMMIVAGALSEELGWRGLALESLQQKFAPFLASAILAPIWWIWHLPLFSFQGTTQYAWGWFTPMFWVFMCTVFCLTFLFTPAYNQNGRSTLAVILFHFSFNYSLALASPLSLRSWVILVILLAGSTAVLWLPAVRSSRAWQLHPGRLG
jgi:uncharacterized protein